MIACVLDCRQPRRHTTDCPDPDTCHGCQPRPATHGALCDGCHKGLQRDLTRSGPAAVLLRGHLPPDLSQALSDERHGTSEDGPPAPIRIDVLDALNAILDTLAWWAQAHAGQHDLRGPAHTDAASTSAYLLAQLASVECMAGVGTLVYDLDLAMRKAYELAPWQEGVRRLGEPCPVCHEAKMVMVASEGVARCRKCGNVMSETLYEHWARVIIDKRQPDTRISRTDEPSTAA